MQSVTGTYENGKLKLDRSYKSKKPVKVVVTFLEDVQEKPAENLVLSDFSFAKSRKNLATLKTSLSETVAEERRIEQ